MKKIRHLYYKDLAAFRFFGMIAMSLYIITYLILVKEESKLTLKILSYTSEIKNIGLNLFFILSSFLLTVQGLREYKCFKCFSIKQFYIRRFLKITPVLILGLLFYFFIHPLTVNFLKLTPLNGVSSLKNILLFPSQNQNFPHEIYIYAYVIWTFLLFIMFYALWGLILKYLRRYISLISFALIISGIIIKFLPQSNYPNIDMYLYYFNFEIGVGSLMAWMIRQKKSIIDWFKELSNTQIVSAYILMIIIGIITLLVLNYAIFITLTKLIISLFICFMILEQTFARHSIFKLRDNKLLTQFGKISYNMIGFTPIIAVTTLIVIESIDKSLDSSIIKFIFPIITFFITWAFSELFYRSISQFFRRMKLEFKPLK